MFVIVVTISIFDTSNTHDTILVNSCAPVKSGVKLGQMLVREMGISREGGDSSGGPRSSIASRPNPRL